MWKANQEKGAPSRSASGEAHEYDRRGIRNPTMKENQTETKKFTYTYRTPTQEERREIENIRNQYTGAKENPPTLQRLRRLDRRVQSFPRTAAVLIGIVGILIFGAGLALTIEYEIYLAGIILGAAGIVLMGINVPLYRIIYRYQYRKYGDEIVRLAEELLHE